MTSHGDEKLIWKQRYVDNIKLQQLQQLISTPSSLSLPVLRVFSFLPAPLPFSSGGLAGRSD
jgi:hypothetical protein